MITDFTMVNVSLVERLVKQVALLSPVVAVGRHPLFSLLLPFSELL
jgi:hypothetical protein